MRIRLLRSLRFQIASASTVVVLFVSAFVGIYYPARSARAAIDAQSRRLAGAAEMVALSVGVGLDLQEPRAIAAAFAWARRDSSLRYVAVLDSTGTLIAAYNPDHLNIAVGTERSRRDVHEWQDHFVIAAPVQFQDLPLGDVVLATSLAPIHAAAAAERRDRLAGSGVLLLLGIGLSVWIASRITRPIVKLQRATEAIASGRYEVELDVPPGTEVSALATSFRTMAAKIRSQMTDLEVQADELVAARDAALSATKAKSAFLATMSHEIRTPMNGVIGMLELMEDGQLSAAQREFARTATRSAEALLTIINDILDFSKVEAGKLDLEHIEFDLWNTIEDVTTLLAERVEEKGLELVTAIRPDVPVMAWGDPGRLRQVLLNLVGNAVKFTKSGEVVVTVRRSTAGDQTPMLRFEVADSGAGVSPEAAARLFEPFSQADSSTTRQFGGTGLGLAISRQLVGLMGGEIGLTSEVGIGSTFWFTTRNESLTVDMTVQELPSLHDLTVLVVDDNHINRQVLHQMLTSWGMKPVLADSGPRAVTALRSLAARGTVPAFALLDMQMPGMDGVALGRVLREDPALHSMQLILLTSIGVRDDIRREGFAAAMVKPVRQTQLRECLLRLTANAAGPDEPNLPAVPHVMQPTTRAGDILLVEDNEVNQLVAVELLQRLGYRVDVASSGLEALEAIEVCRYDVVLMDCQMSGMDGFETTIEIRRRGWTSDKLPIIAMTANAMQGDRERCLAAGMDDYIAKPVRRAMLTAMLDRYVGAAPEPQSESHVAATSHLIGGALDGSQLQDLLGDDRTTWRRYLDPFLASARPSLVTLYQGLDDQHSDTVRRVAHQLKGSAATVGATQVAELAREMEWIADTGAWDRADATRAQMDSAMGRVATVTLELS